MTLDYIKNHTFFHDQKERCTDKNKEISLEGAFQRNYRIVNEGFGVDKFFVIVSGAVEDKSMDIPYR